MLQARFRTHQRFVRHPEAKADMDKLSGSSGNDSEWEDYDEEGREEADEEMDEASAVAQARAVAVALRSGQAGTNARGNGGACCNQPWWIEEQFDRSRN